MFYADNVWQTIYSASESKIQNMQYSLALQLTTQSTISFWGQHRHMGKLPYIGVFYWYLISEDNYKRKRPRCALTNIGQTWKKRVSAKKTNHFFVTWGRVNLLSQKAVAYNHPNGWRENIEPEEEQSKQSVWSNPLVRDYLPWAVKVAGFKQVTWQSWRRSLFVVFWLGRRFRATGLANGSGQLWINFQWQGLWSGKRASVCLVPCADRTLTSITLAGLEAAHGAGPASAQTWIACGELKNWCCPLLGMTVSHEMWLCKFSYQMSRLCFGVPMNLWSPQWFQAVVLSLVHWNVPFVSPSIFQRGVLQTWQS